jgi:hypothetical protein
MDVDKRVVATTIGVGKVLVETVVAGGLATTCPLTSRKTPWPASQQFGNLSQQRLPLAQVITFGKKPVVSSIYRQYSVCLE